MCIKSPSPLFVGGGIEGGGGLCSGALRGVPRRVGSGKENGEAVFFVAREGAALPLVEFDFNYLTLLPPNRLKTAVLEKKLKKSKKKLAFGKKICYICIATVNRPASTVQ
jgi:hypothetical protein